MPAQNRPAAPAPMTTTSKRSTGAMIDWPACRLPIPRVASCPSGASCMDSPSHTQPTRSGLRPAAAGAPLSKGDRAEAPGGAGRVVLGIETSCDETGVALYDTRLGLRAQMLHSQAAMHERYGGVVPELASRDHVQRLAPLIRLVLEEAGVTLPQVDAIGYTRGPGLAGALLV